MHTAPGLADAVDVTLNGGAWAGGPIAVDGDYVLVARALRGGVEVGRATVTFSIDTVAPVVTITGVTDGLATQTPVTVAVAGNDANLLATTTTLDFAPFAAGDVSGEGKHVLVVTALDRAGNTTTRTVTFWIDRIAPVTTATIPAGVLDAHSTITLAATDTWEARHLQLGSGTVATHYALDGTAHEYTAPLAFSGLTGTHTLTYWSVDRAGNEEAHATATLDFGSQRVETTTTVTVAPAPSTYGQTITITVTVTAAGSTPTGSVQLSIDGGAPTTLALAAGSATFDVATLAAGAHTISASYLGSLEATPSNGSASHTVAQAPTAITLLAAPASPLAGVPVTLTATVSPTAFGGSPTGSVVFLDGATPIATVALAGGVAIATVTLSAGLHTLGAEYSGDANFAGSSSTPVPVTAQTRSVSVADASAVEGGAATFVVSLDRRARSSSRSTGSPRTAAATRARTTPAAPGPSRSRRAS